LAPRIKLPLVHPAVLRWEPSPMATGDSTSHAAPGFDRHRGWPPIRSRAGHGNGIDKPVEGRKDHRSTQKPAEEPMSILIKAGKQCYEIPTDQLKKFKVTKKQLMKKQKKLSADVAGQCWDCNLVDLSTCCMSKKSLWASC
jgi:hypothetical protein